MAALEGLWGHGSSHRLGPASPRATRVPLPRCIATMQHASPGTPQGTLPPPGHQVGGTHLLLWGHWGNAYHPGDSMGNVPTSRTTRRERSPPWGQHGGGQHLPRQRHHGGDTGCSNATVGRSSQPRGHSGWGDAHCPRGHLGRTLTALGTPRGNARDPGPPWGHPGGGHDTIGRSSQPRGHRGWWGGDPLAVPTLPWGEAHSPGATAGGCSLSPGPPRGHHGGETGH